MRSTVHRPLRLPVGGIALFVSLALACDGGGPLGNEAPVLARAGGDPTVKSTVPDSAPLNTTLTVQVLGTGYEPGAQATWALQGDTSFAATRIKTNSTTFVNSTELRANITIGGEAPIAAYDVMVTLAGGRKGVGIEKFKVVYDVSSYSLGMSRATQIDPSGRVAGVAYDRKARKSGPALWTPALPLGTSGSVSVLAFADGSTEVYGLNRVGQLAGMMYLNGMGYMPAVVDNGAHVLPLLPGMTQGWALSISDPLPDGQRLVVGNAGNRAVVWRVTGQGASFAALSIELLPGNSGEADAVSADGRYIVGGYPGARWDWNGSSWGHSLLEPLPGDTAAHASSVNLNGVAVGQSTPSGGAVVWPSGSTVPIELPGTSYNAWTINEAGYIGGGWGWLWTPLGGSSYSGLQLGSPSSPGGEIRDLSEPRLENGRVTLDAVAVNGRLIRIRLP